jgi:hypothetical protein
MSSEQEVMLHVFPAPSIVEREIEWRAWHVAKGVYKLSECDSVVCRLGCVMLRRRFRKATRLIKFHLVAISCVEGGAFVVYTLTSH